MTTMQKEQIFSKKFVLSACWQACLKFNPMYMVKNPVMFVVEIGFFATILFTLFPQMLHDDSPRLYNAIIAIILGITIWFANFAEAMTQGRGKAQVETLKKTKTSMRARIIKEGKEQWVEASTLMKGDRVIVRAGEVIPNDGEVIEGVATVDKSAITGESAPVVKERGGDFSSVTGGTIVTSGEIIIEITSLPGASFLDQMIALIEGAKRQKTPNEIALSTLLVSLTIIFLLVVVTLKPMADYFYLMIPLATLIALMVCLIPTTIGGLLSAIGIAGMDRVTQFNVIAKDGRAVEACGDVDVLILDKTGTITYGNRMATSFHTAQTVELQDLMEAAYYSSLADDTPEGKSILTLIEQKGVDIPRTTQTFEEVPFTAQTRMSGIDLEDGTTYRKGAFDTVKKYVGSCPNEVEAAVQMISNKGGTPLVVTKNKEILGAIYLKDVVKEGLKERFQLLRKMGIQTIMCTGDNPLTAAAIAEEAGVDSFIAESKPEDKLEVIRKAQREGKVVAMTGDGTNDAPALAQANVGVAMNSGTNAAKEAANMVDLDSNPTKIIEIVQIGKQLLMTRGALTTFSIANDVAKYFAIIPAIFLIGIPGMQMFNLMHLSSPVSAVLSALLFNALIIPLLIPVAMRGVPYRPMSANRLLRKNLLIYGVGGLVIPFIGIKLIDVIITPILKSLGLS